MNQHRANYAPEPAPLRWATTMSIVFVLLFIALLGLAQLDDERAKAQDSLYAMCPRTQAVAAFVAEGL